MRLDEYHQWLDELGVEEQHPIRECADNIVDFVYNTRSVSGNARSLEGAAIYTATLLEGTGDPSTPTHHFTQKEVADIVGVSPSTLQRQYSSIISAKDDLNRWP